MLTCIRSSSWTEPVGSNTLIQASIGRNQVSESVSGACMSFCDLELSAVLRRYGNDPLNAELRIAAIDDFRRAA